jgi:GT2 family glycosyltransferase
MYDGFRARAAGVQQVDWLGSGSLAVWRDVFERVGGFDSRLETCEDVDFCQRLRRSGYGLWSDDRLRSVHLGDPRTIRCRKAQSS